jgi:YidC/Oxa1 family membrane protein insertase
VLTFGSFGLAILLFTVMSRVVLFPLTLRTLRATRRMQDLQPRMQEIQKKYSDPRRRTDETMKLYKEAGVNPIGCLGPTLLQFPIFIALYQVIRRTVATTPESVVGLSDRLYDVGFIQDAIPLSTSFLFLDLAANGGIVLTVAVFVSMWLQQRISTGRTAGTSTKNDQQQQMQSMMQWMMPAMFAWFVLAVPAGLGLYWAASTIIGIVLQWVFVGPGDFTWGSLVPAPARARLGIADPPAPGSRAITSAAQTQTETATVGEGDSEADDADNESRTADAGSRNKRKNSRRGRRSRSGAARTQGRSGRRRRNSGG